MLARLYWRLIFGALYLRNLPGFDGHHVYVMAASRMDVDLIRYRRAQARKARATL